MRSFSFIWQSIEDATYFPGAVKSRSSSSALKNITNSSHFKWNRNLNFQNLLRGNVDKFGQGWQTEFIFEFETESSENFKFYRFEDKCINKIYCWIIQKTFLSMWSKKLTQYLYTNFSSTWNYCCTNRSARNWNCNQPSVDWTLLLLLLLLLLFVLITYLPTYLPIKP